MNKEITTQHKNKKYIHNTTKTPTNNKEKAYTLIKQSLKHQNNVKTPKTSKHTPTHQTIRHKRKATPHKIFKQKTTRQNKTTPKSNKNKPKKTRIKTKCITKKNRQIITNTHERKTHKTQTNICTIPYTKTKTEKPQTQQQKKIPNKKNNTNNKNPPKWTRPTGLAHKKITIIYKQKITYKKNLPPIQTFSLHLLLLISGDIETNPGPMPNVLQTHPSTHRNRGKMYFIECTIKLKPEYQHLAQQFSSIIKRTHPEHQDIIIKYPHLARFMYINQHHPPPRISYAIITTISLVIETCNHILMENPEPEWTTTVLERMTILQNPPERHITNTHPYTKFLQTNQDIINPPNTIHKELYTFIKQSNEPLTIQLMTDKFLFLPEKLLTESLKYT